MASSFRDWAWLPPELLNYILIKLGRFSDYIRFCGVCRQWRKVAFVSDISRKQRLIFLRLSRKKLPLLLINTEKNNIYTRNLYSISDGATYNLQLPIPCSKGRFFGSSHGWLMYYHENMAVSIFNPLNNNCISLPIFEAGYLIKGILSRDPTLSPNNYLVAVIYDIEFRNLAVYSPGYTRWKKIHLRPHNAYVFNDIFLRERKLYGVTRYKFYGVTNYSKVVEIDIGRQERVNGAIYFDGGAAVNYLVESQGDLLLVQRFWSIKDENLYFPRAKTDNFKVFKFWPEEYSSEWVQINNIGEQALFVGGNTSVSVSTIEFPECMSNSVYYTSQFYSHISPYKCFGPDEDSGFFRLEDKSFHSHHILDTFEWHMEPPIWFVPNPDFATLA